MLKLGGAVILMQQSLTDVSEILSEVQFLVGSVDLISLMQNTLPRRPFDETIIEFSSCVSGLLMNSKEAKAYPDIVTLGFWLRKSSVITLKERFEIKEDNIRMGRGVAFHIAPSNVPVNYAYSLFTGLLTGNANIVRIPTKDYPQIFIINTAIKEALEIYPAMKPYICLLRYNRSESVNSFLSSLSDIRIIWGGDNTISEIRKSPLKPRANEITFADRYSLAVIDSDQYIASNDKKRIAEAFYNDTYLTDQNACTSPRVLVWVGSKKNEAKKVFWDLEHDLVLKKYHFQPIMGIDKLASVYLLAATKGNIHLEDRKDNFIFRVKVHDLNPELMEFKGNSGFFFEYDCDNILDIRKFCTDVQCQTIGFMGEKNMIMPLLKSGIKGVDRVVPIGRTMDFDFIWDGYNLAERFTRTIHLNI